MKRNSIQAVIFDMDGLMLDSQRIATEVWKSAVEAFGYRLTDETRLSLIGRTISDTNAILRSAFGSNFPINEIRRLATEEFSALTRDSGIPVKRGLRELLDFLDQKHLQTAVATSTSRYYCLRSLQRSDLAHRFKVIVCGDEVPQGKPAPDIFLRASELLDVVPERCVVLEDSYAGVRAAHNARMIPIMVPDLKEADDEMRALAHAVVSDLTAAKDVIQKLLNDAITQPNPADV
jgi:HAD superfamily hydrolase (TIGR01509 family)